MTYKPYLISNYSTGIDRELQPWLIPDDAFQDLFDGYVYEGVTQKRDGYNGFANGIKSTYCESRMVVQVTATAMTGTIDGINKIFTLTATPPVRRGTFVVTGNNPAQTLTDDGDGTFTGDGTGTINYTTGSVTVTFTTAPAVASTVLATYDYHPGLPVMGVMSYYSGTTVDANARSLLVADTRNVNIYNPSTDRLDFVANTSTYTGAAQDFWSWVNYPVAATNAPRLLFCNGVTTDFIQAYNGTSVANWTFTFTISGAPATLNARQMFFVRDRLVLFQTSENGTLYPRRIRISGTGTSGDIFDNTATGAGFIDIPDNTWFFGADFNRDDLIVYTEAATWMLKYTGNDTTPFILQKIDGSRGSAAAFSVTSYLNRTVAASQRGLIISDGYKVERMDKYLNNFSFENINSEQFKSCFSGFLDEERDVYLIYPSNATERPEFLAAGESDRILAMNFEDNNFAIYRFALSCMGNFQQGAAVLWSDLTEAKGFPNWDTLGAKYGSWLDFPFTPGSPLSLGGGHKGEVWRLNATESQDNPQQVRDITAVDSTTLRVTTDWNNYQVGDYITFEDVEGMTEVNNKQYAIDAINTNYTIFDINIDGTGFIPYTGGGVASRSIPFEALSKKFNPFANADKKVKCGWIYFYVSTAVTSLTDDNGDSEPAFLTIEIITNDNVGSTDLTPPMSYKIDCSNLTNETGSKNWRKIWINQTAKFIQFKMTNVQAGAKIQVHAMMPGFQPMGRLV